MEREVDNIFTGVCVAVIVCIVSGFLYYMFKHAAFVPSRSVPITRDIIGLRKKVKKSDSKKSKKAKKTKQVLELDELAEQEVDKTQTSDENFDEDEEPLQDTPDELEKDDSPIPSGEKTDGPLCKPVTPMTTVSPPGDLANGDLATGKSSAEQKSQLTSEHSQEPKISNNDSDFADQPEAPLVVSSEEFAQSVPLEAVPLKSKRSKRRKSKRSTPPATPLPVEPILDLPCVEQVAGPSEKLPQLVPTKIPTSADDSQAQESHEDLKKLTDQLNANQNKLAEVSKQVVTLSEENKRLRVKEEETTLGLRVLQEQYTELLRTNKSLEHERSLKDIKLKNLESEKSNILSRLDHTNSEVGRLKNEAEMETRKLREQLAESKSKLATMAAAIASAPPPGPSPELVRAQELAQAVSSDNCLLKSRLEQMETELSQLRQAGLLQQQELQALRVENRKLHSEKESALGEFQAQRQAEQAESSSRIANYEAQLQHRHHELEAETQRSKDFALKLNEARTELSHVAEREKRQSEIISSLEYQFAELNAEKQRLTEEVNRTKALNETCANELRIQVANMTNDLQRTTNELHDVRQRADRLAAELEVMKQSTTDSLVPSPPVSVSVSVETTETIVDMVDEEKRKQSTATEEAEEYKKKTDQIIEHIRTQLSTKEQQLKEAEENAEGAQRRVEEATMELTHYKTTLLETEKVLANLQRSVEKTEKNWTNLLKRSELEQNKLKCELTEVHSQTEKIANRMKELETQLDLERRESSRLRSELVEQVRIPLVH
ncbi:unnamed protein product [Calicophoron daubneyi]|uniref:Uncharacterized protein n=1 Tax=Calicophoron daubneyi TaxID=300641 RepID=A0AAV2T593_CALDB